MEYWFSYWKFNNKVTKDDFKFLYIIGKGGFCTVYKTTYKDTKKVYALKVIDKSILNNDEQIKNIINEI